MAHLNLASTTVIDGDAHASLQTRLAKLTRVYGFTQREIATACGVTQQTVSRWIKGTAIPSPERAAELAEILDQFQASELGGAHDSQGGLAAYLRAAGLPLTFPSLESIVAAGDGSEVYLNSTYARNMDALALTRLETVHAHMPLGHGSSTLAYELTRRLMEHSGLSRRLTARISLERLLASPPMSSEELSEAATYSALREVAEQSEGDGVENGQLRLAVDEWFRPLHGSSIGTAIDHVILEDVREQISNNDWKIILGPAQDAILTRILSGEPAWKEALAALAVELPLTIVLDLSPTPLGRTLDGQPTLSTRDGIFPQTASAIQEVLDTVMRTLQGIPKIQYILFHTVGIDGALPCTALPSIDVEEDRAFPPLVRADFFNILSRRHGRQADSQSLLASLDDSVLPDVQSVPISTATRLLRVRLHRLTANAREPGVRINDAAAAELRELERRVGRLEATLDRVLSILEHKASPVN